MQANKRNIIICGLALLAFLSCAKRAESNRNKPTATEAVATSVPQNQVQQQQAEATAQQQNIQVQWESAEFPISDGVGNINVVTTFSYNSKLFQITSSHQVNGGSVSAFQQQSNMNVDGMGVTVQAGCSDSQCSQYALTYNFYQNGKEAIQLLVWVSFSADVAPRIHSLSAGQFWNLNTWYNFASNQNNFLAP